MKKGEKREAAAKSKNSLGFALRSDMLAFLTRQLSAFLFPFFHEDFSLLLLGRAEGLASGG